MNRGQVSSEAVVSISILLLLFAVVLIYNSNMRQENDFLATSSAQKAECEKLVSAIMLVRDSKASSEITLSISFDANISLNTINFPNYYCNFPGLQIDSQLLAGEIKVTKENGVVDVANAQ